MPPAAAAKPDLPDTSERIAALSLAAMQFVSRERNAAIVRKWITRDIEELPHNQVVLAAADAVMLSGDLALSQPSASGKTAFDRLARSAHAKPADAAAIGALCKARFRLLRLDQDAPPHPATMRDVVSDEALRIFAPDFPPLPAGTVLFARVAMLGAGAGCIAGAATPLDPEAYAVARNHPAAGAPGAMAGARWAEAVYCHVVRNGTLNVPGLNRPADFNDTWFDDDDADEDDLPVANAPLIALTMEWEELEGRAPDADLLQRTRQLTDVPTIIDAFEGMAIAQAGDDAGLVAALERVLLVQLETVLLRERSGSGRLTLDAVDRALEKEIAGGRLQPKSGTAFATLRLRLAGGSATRRPGDPELERLVQRIQGLRAKTVAQGCTEQEAIAAAEKVAELLDRYGLSLGELDFRAQPCDGIGIQTTRRRFAPIDSCIPAIAAFFDCRVWVERAEHAPLRYVFFGLRGDVAAAQYLYEMVERAFETETNAFRAGELYRQMAGERRSATQSFQTGLAHGISGKLRAIRQARDSTLRSASGRDLVPMKAAIVDDEMAKLGLDLHQRAVGRNQRVLTEAFAAGEAAGERFEFAPAITRAA